MVQCTFTCSLHKPCIFHIEKHSQQLSYTSTVYNVCSFCIIIFNFRFTVLCLLQYVVSVVQASGLQKKLVCEFGIENELWQKRIRVCDFKPLSYFTSWTVSKSMGFSPCTLTFGLPLLSLFGCSIYYALNYLPVALASVSVTRVWFIACPLVIVLVESVLSWQ